MPDDGLLDVPGAEDPVVSVVILTARNPAYLAACLRGLTIGVADGPSCETILVLNGADRAVSEFVSARVRGAHAIESRVNLGFAGGGNLGRSQARGRLIVLLHDDAVPEEGWLSELVRIADRHPEAGAVGSRILDPDGQLQGAGGVVLRDGSTWLPPVAEPSTVGTRAADWCQSCSLLVRASTWDAIGGLDERFFPAMCVDVDLGLAVWSRGESVLCALQSRVRHRRGASIPSSFRQFLIERHRAVLTEKWADTLAAHEPGGPDAGLAVSGAVSRVEAAANRLVGRAPARVLRDSDADAVGPVRLGHGGERDRDLVALERASDVHEAFIRHVSGIADELHRLHSEVERRDAEIARLQEEGTRRAQEMLRLQTSASDAHSALERSQGTLTAIYNGGWWRLRARLLPVLRAASYLKRGLGR